jgi:hypothetical protein
MLLVFNLERHCRLYVLEDHERNRRGYRKIAFATLNVTRKRVITKVIVEYSEILSRDWDLLLRRWRDILKARPVL